MTHESHHLEEPTNEELRLISRRSALRLLGGAGLAVIAACAAEGATSTTAAAAGSDAPLLCREEVALSVGDLPASGGVHSFALVRTASGPALLVESLDEETSGSSVWL